MDAVAYKNGQKNNWRRYCWNKLSDRVRVKRDAVVLYLPGSTDCDRAEATRRGFHPHNLIAVERDQRVAKKLRAEGKTVINDDLREVVRNWRKPNVAIVFADFQCGLTWNTALLTLKAWLTNPAFAGGSILFNLQRGREPRLDGSREVIGQCNFADSGERHLDVFSRHHDVGPSHRGAMVWSVAITHVAEVRDAWEKCYQAPSQLRTEKPFEWDVPRPYISNVVTMDSIILHDTEVIPRLPLPDHMVNQQTRRNIAAALAVRTGRLAA